MNTLTINNRVNLTSVCESIIERINAGKFHGRETLKGCKWSVEFMASLDHDMMTEAECNHAIRCMTYRGQIQPVFMG